MREDVDERRDADILGWAEEENRLDRLADEAMREGYEPSLTLEGMARELATGRDI